MLIPITRPLFLVQHRLLSKSKIQNLNFLHGFVFILQDHLFTNLILYVATLDRAC